jgi:predicted phosphodiesterase
MAYRLMIIDDDMDRASFYKAVFSGPDFEPIFIWSMYEFSSAKETPVDGYIVDIFLAGQKWGNIKASTLIKEHIQNAPRPAPVFLVSENWGDKEVLLVLKEIASCDVRVVQYLAWSEFVDAAESNASDAGKAFSLERIRLKHLQELNIWHGRSDLRPGPDQLIRILVLSDLQYKDPHTHRNAAATEHKIIDALEESPHIIVIAGDVAYSGSPDEYEMAYHHITNDIIAPLWGKHAEKWKGERVVMVPGNHDVNLRFSSCENWKFDFQKMKLAQIKKVSTVSDMGSAISSASHVLPLEAPFRNYRSHQDYALGPFRQFAYALTKDRNWNDSNSLSWVDRRFADCGIQFLILNTIPDLSWRTPSRASFDKGALDQINRSMGGSRERYSGKADRAYCNIALSHHGLRPYGKQNAVIENWDEIGKQYFEVIRPHLWIFGHYHKFDTWTVNDGPFKRYPFDCIQAATPRIQGDEPRGFCTLKLKVVNGIVEQGWVKNFELTSDGCRAGDEQELGSFQRSK